MVRTKFTIGGAIPAKTGAFCCEKVGRRAVSAANCRDRRRIGLAAASAGGRRAGRQSMASVFHPNPNRLARLGYSAPIIHVPVIFDSRTRYCREQNRYLRERALLEWHPGAGADVPRPRTLKNIADRLCNFIQWCEARSLDWRTITYSQVLAYQREQINGSWSHSPADWYRPHCTEPLSEGQLGCSNACPSRGGRSPAARSSLRDAQCRAPLPSRFC